MIATIAPHDPPPPSLQMYINTTQQENDHGGIQQEIHKMSIDTHVK